MLNKLILDGMFLSFTNFLAEKRKEIEYQYLIDSSDMFIGGSYRFGYTNGKSDLDIFLYNPDFKAMLSFMLNNGFSINNDTYYDSAVSISLKHTTHKIHLNIVGNLNGFNKIKEEHDFLQDFIEKNPLTIKFAHALKNQGLKGSDVYKILLEIGEIGISSPCFQTESFKE